MAVPYVFFDGEVTASAPNPWKVSPFFAAALTLDDQVGDERVELVGDPFPVATGCEQGPAPSDASALARSIQSDPDLQVTAPVGVSVGGVGGLAMDVTVAPGASVCEVIPSTQVLTQDDGHTGPGPPGLNLDQGSRMRLYLLDLPEGSGDTDPGDRGRGTRGAFRGRARGGHADHRVHRVPHGLTASWAKEEGMKRKKRLCSLGAALSLALAACGGDDEARGPRLVILAGSFPTRRPDCPPARCR